MQVIGSDGREIDVPREAKRAMADAVGRLVKAETDLAHRPASATAATRKLKAARATPRPGASRRRSAKGAVREARQAASNDNAVLREQIRARIRDDIRASVRDCRRGLSRLPGQLAIGRPVRPRGFLAEAADLVLLIGFEIAFEPFDVAVAFERQDVRRQAIEEEAVVADDHRAAGEILDRLLERAQRLDVEIVGRLVEQQHVAAALQHLGDVDAVALAA